MNTDFVNALKFVDRAISCCPNYAYAHQLRGSILLSNRKPEQAIASFQRANDISCDMDSYEGLVESYLAAEKFREALFSAKEAINLSPKDPRAMSLVGLTLAYTSKDSNRSSNKQELEERAKRALKKGLELNPSAPRPLLKLLDLYLKSKEYDKGIEILMNAIDSEKDGIRGGTTNTWTALNVCHLQPLSYYGSGAAVRECKDILYTKLGVVHTLTKNYIEACKAFHMALSINPSNKEARRAYDRLETTMTGDECQFLGSDDELNNSWDQKDDNDSDEY
jgi:anaphase-promoting complex subunit 7